MEIQADRINLSQDRPESKSFIQTRLSQISQIQAELSSIRVQSDSDLPDLPVGVEIPAVDAVGWTKGHRSVDIRPRLVDKASGVSRLIDTGAQLSATVRLPGDEVDDSIRLVAVNGSKIKTYGVRTVNLKIGRKSYSIEAIICDVKEDILGSDFIKKYKLSLEWDDCDQSELSIVDKRAQISQSLRIVTVPTDLQRAGHVEKDQGIATVSQNDTTLFEISCMKNLNDKTNTAASKKLTSEEALKLHDLEYADMIRAFPQPGTKWWKMGSSRRSLQG